MVARLQRIQPLKEFALPRGVSILQRVRERCRVERERRLRAACTRRPRGEAERGERERRRIRLPREQRDYAGYLLEREEAADCRQGGTLSARPAAYCEAGRKARLTRARLAVLRHI